MNRNDFVSIVPRIKVWETKLLNQSFYGKLMDLNSLEEAVQALQETPYGVGLNDGVNFEQALNDSFKDLCSDLNALSANNYIVSFVRIKNDYHNGKTLVKGNVLNKDFSYILNGNGTVELESLKMAVKSGDYREVPELIGNAIGDSLFEFENSKDAQVIDIVFDRYMFKHMEAIVSHMDNEFMNKYLKTIIDLTNIKTVLRLKKINKDKQFLKNVFISGGTLDLDICQGILVEDYENIPNKLSVTPYELVIREGISDYLKTKSLSSLEKRIDDYIMKFVRDAKYVNFGVEPVFAYLYARETEIKNLRIILAGKLNKVDSIIIEERLRDNYV